MKDIVFNTLKSMIDEKEKANIEPTHIIDMDLFNKLAKSVKSSLNELYIDGKIGITRTGNHKAIYIKDNTNE